MGIADDAVQFRLGDALDQIDGKCDHLKKRRIDEKEFQDCLQKALQLVAGWKDHVSVKFSCSPLDPMMRGCAIRAGVHEAVDVLSLLIGAFVPATAKDCVDEFTSQCQNGAKDMSFLSRAIQLRSIFKRVEVEAVGLCADENLRIAFVEQGVFPESAHNEVEGRLCATHHNASKYPHCHSCRGPRHFKYGAFAGLRCAGLAPSEPQAGGERCAW
jgi:hypothetical protein